MDEQDKQNQKPKIKIVTFSGKHKALFLAGCGFSLLLFLAFVFGVMFFLQVGLFEILGVKYDSWGTVALFVSLTFLFDILISIFVFGLKLVGFRFLQQFPGYMSSIVLNLLRIVTLLVVVHLMDVWMEGVTMSNLSELLLVLVVFTINKFLFGSRRISIRVRKD